MFCVFMATFLYLSGILWYFFPLCVLFYLLGLAPVCLLAQEASNAINVYTEIGCPIQTQ